MRGTVASGRSASAIRPAGVDPQLLARRAIDDRDRGRRSAEIELDDREAVQRRIGERDALAGQELADFRQPNALLQPLLDGCLLRTTPAPTVATRPPARGMERQQHVADLRVGDYTTVARQARRFSPGDVP